MFPSNLFQTFKGFGSYSNKKVKTKVASVTESNTVNSSTEVIPWGVQAVWQGEDISQRGNFASDTYAFVIDSGVSDQTGDLNFAPLDWSKSWIVGQSPFTDVNGHGTHVAGTIGSLVNGKGIVGVAPGAQIISLKVNNDFGFGDGTTTAEAVNYAVDVINKNNLNKDKVVINLSISATFDPLLNNTIINAANQGIKFAIAAGNNGQDVDRYSPSSTGYHPNVYVVSAVDSSLKMPFWSNWDRLDSGETVDDVDFAAPGVGVLSYYKNGQLAELSGTSQASPHVAGLLITGGVQAGNTTIPNTTNTADPFAITSTQQFNPSATISTPQQPPSPPQSTFSLNTNSTISEGQTLKVNISTTNVKEGTTLYWQMSGTGLDMEDFQKLDNKSKLDGFWGNPKIASDGTATVEFNVRNDELTEGDEVLKFELFDSAGNLRQKVAETFITIQDTSKTPPPMQFHWGTIGNDVITGGQFKDTLTGVLSSGTTQSSMGVGQIDILTGGFGPDIFVLGDRRGVFYNDGIKNNMGQSDYALIQDFRIGEDKLQVRSGAGGYVSEVKNGNLFLYLDNYNGRLDTTGSSQDELIAVLSGVTALGNAEYLGVR